MKMLQPSWTATLFFIVILLLFNHSANAQFADSLALFVVADDVNLNTAENEIITRLGEMSFDVEIVNMNDVTDDYTESAALVLISATVSSGTVATNMPGLKDLPMPVINWEPFLYDAQGFSAGDGGEFNTIEIDIVRDDHPLAAGLPADIYAITNSEKGVSYGVPQGDVIIIAVNPLADSQAVLFAYEKGAAMFSGNAPARRVGTFLLNDVADDMTEEGWLLFDASVIWAMGAESPGFVQDLTPDIPSQFNLYDNYPNPFNPVTNIAFSIPTQDHVRLTIFNALGEQITTLIDEIRPPGNHRVTFNAADIVSGLYFYRLEFSGQTITKKMLIVK